MCEKFWTLSIPEALGDFFPEAHWQRCAVHFYRNVLSAVPVSRFRKVSAMLKAIHAQEGESPYSGVNFRGKKLSHGNAFGMFEIAQPPKPKGEHHGSGHT